LLWGQQECYQSKRAKDYLNQLDLEEGKVLYEQCQEYGPHYGEVIKNRKFGIFRLIERCCSAKIKGQQLVIASGT
jgi:hypothetical protein